MDTKKIFNANEAMFAISSSLEICHSLLALLLENSNYNSDKILVGAISAAEMALCMADEKTTSAISFMQDLKKEGAI